MVIVVIITLLVYSIVSPVLDKFAQLLMSWMEVLIAKNGLIISKVNKEIQDLQKTEAPTKKVVIGFGANKEEEQHEL